MCLGFTIIFVTSRKWSVSFRVFHKKPPKGNYSKPSEATSKFNTINMKKVCYPRGPLPHHCVYISKELIHSP